MLKIGMNFISQHSVYRESELKPATYSFKIYIIIQLL
jgi:hypothetical protein